MKKIVCLTTLLLALTAFNVNAKSFLDRLHTEFVAGAGLKNNSVTPVDFSFRILAEVFPRTQIFIVSEENLSLYDTNFVRTYYYGESLGGGLGIILLGAKEESSHTLDLRAQVLTSAGNTDWKRTSYDLALAYYLKSRYTPILELGYRYNDSRTRLDDFGTVYLKFGIRY